MVNVNYDNGAIILLHMMPLKYMVKALTPPRLTVDEL